VRRHHPAGREDVMAFRFTIECDDERDFGRLLRDHFFADVLPRSLKAEGRRMLRSRDIEALKQMAASHDGLTSHQLAEAMGLPVAKLGPVIRHLRKRLPFDQIVTATQHRERDTQGRLGRRYRVTEFGRTFIRENG
jgi:hypothetical protein